MSSPSPPRTASPPPAPSPLTKESGNSCSTSAPNSPIPKSPKRCTSAHAPSTAIGIPCSQSCTSPPGSALRSGPSATASSPYNHKRNPKDEQCPHIQRHPLHPQLFSV